MWLKPEHRVSAVPGSLQRNGAVVGDRSRSQDLTIIQNLQVPVIGEGGQVGGIVRSNLHDAGAAGGEQAPVIVTLPVSTTVDALLLLSAPTA